MEVTEPKPQRLDLGQKILGALFLIAAWRLLTARTQVERHLVIVGADPDGKASVPEPAGGASDRDDAVSNAEPVGSDD